VLVLEKHDSISKVVVLEVQTWSTSALMTNLKATGSCRMPPNLSKILFHRSLERELLKISLKSQGILNSQWSDVLLRLGALADSPLVASGKLLGGHV
jgi:hypothetical protein